MSALQSVVDHFEGLRGGHIEVPEWGLTVYWKPLTMKERSAIHRTAAGDNYKLMCLVLERRALDGKGVRMFEGGDASKLMRKADSNVIIRVAEIMMAVPGVDEAEKN